MLQKLVIRNYAIIDHLSLEPDAHLNTVTGETGAGKSIILGALSLILGDRADSSVLINKSEKCVVEAHFDVAGNTAFARAIKEEDLDNEPGCIIRREIAVSGKSRAFINDTPVTLTVLNKLTSLLVDLHQQFDHLALQDDSFQLDVLDAVAKNDGLKKEYSSQYRAWRKTEAELERLKTAQSTWQKEADYKQYLLDELLQAAYKENEIEEADTQLKSLAHAERITGTLAGTRMLLGDGEMPIVNEIRKMVQSLQGISDLLPASKPLCERLSSVHAELKDLEGELSALEESVSLDPALMQQLQERVDLGYRLFKKHGVKSTSELLELQASLESALQASINVSDNIERLEKEAATLLKTVGETAAKLSAQRKKASPGIAKEVNRLLHLVGMPNAQFDIRISPLKAPAAAGSDTIAFLLDANKSGQFQPLHKAASGGEMSRIMLSIKSLTAQAMELPTLIFDEVDTGISGEAAKQVGYLLRDLAKYHQVVCITHQPQVAARGAKHFFVYKDAGDGKSRITTKVRVLKSDERIDAIAKMIGGEQPGEAALQHARELVEA